MHVIVNRSALLEVLGVASGVTAVRTPKEVLRCVRLTTTDGSLMVSATDLEVALRGEVRQVEVVKAGDILVPADKLMSIARESADSTLALEAEEQVCHVRGQDSHFEVYGQNPKEFPPVPDLEGAPDLEVEVAVLQELIDRTIFAVAKESTRYAINGVLWDKSGKKLALVATDGRRLARASGAGTAGTSEDARMIVPGRTMQVLQRILTHAEGNVGVRFSNSQVIVRSGAYVVSSALAEGQFPDYTRVIPEDNDKKVELNTEELLSAVRRAALLTNEQSKGIRLAFGREQLVLSGRAPEQGAATISMSVDYNYEPVEIGFNPVFLIEALRVVGAPTVTLEMRDANRPGVFRRGEAFLYVVMPVGLS